MAENSYPQGSLPSNPSFSTTSIPPDLDLPTDSNFKVYVRCRPLSSKELSSGASKKQLNIIRKHENIVFVLDPDSEPGRDPTTSISKKDRSYHFSDVFDEGFSNEMVYSKILPLPPKLLSGINCTVFAYGQTSAGKTHTMFGCPETDPGINFRLLDDLLTSLKRNVQISYTLKASYLEIYNEQIRDLLVANSGNLLIFEDPVRGFMVSDLSEIEVADCEDLRKLVIHGNTRRTMAATGANQFSSRSHAILQIFLEISKDKESKLQSKLNLIDLAGSERAAATDNRGLRMKESANINRSLMTLGLCINILSDTSKKGVFVPYRDSKLTKLLRDSLGGNTMTFMIACVSPFAGVYDETINTLKYAAKAKNITKKVTRNVVEIEMSVVQYKKIVEDLRKEIKDLRKELEAKTSSNPKKNPNNLGEERHREKIFEEIGERIFQNLQENWELQQSLNELIELHAQNEERLLSLLDRERTEHENKEALEHEIKGLRLIMDNNEKVKKGLEFSLRTNEAQKKSLQEYLRDFHRHEAAGGESGPGENSQKMKEMEMEMEHMRRKLAEKDLLIEKNNKLLEILRKNHERSSNFSPQFYPLPHTSNKSSISFFPGTIPQSSLMKKGSPEQKSSLIYPIKIPDAKTQLNAQSAVKLSDRSHKKNPLIPQRFFNHNVNNSMTGGQSQSMMINDTSIMRGTEEEKREVVFTETPYMNQTSNSTINPPFTPQQPTFSHGLLTPIITPNNASVNTSSILSLNKSLTCESPTKMPSSKMAISMDNASKLIPSKRDSPVKAMKKQSILESSNTTANTITSSGNTNNNGLIINVILKGNSSNGSTSTIAEQGPVRKKSSRDLLLEEGNNPAKAKESIKLSLSKGSSSTTNKSFKKMAVNVSYDNIQQAKKAEIPLMKATLTNPKQSLIPSRLPPTQPAAITLKTPTAQANTALIPSKQLNLSALSSLSKQSSSKQQVPSTGMLKNQRISVSIMNLDRARENYKNFKEKLGKFNNFSKDDLNDSLKKAIQQLLADHSQNQYVLSQTDQALVGKLKGLVEFNTTIAKTVEQSGRLKDPRLELHSRDEKARSNSVMVMNTRSFQGEVNESKKNEDEILLLLDNKKFGRISSDRINSDHQRSAMIFQESGSWFESLGRRKTGQGEFEEDEEKQDETLEP